MKRNYMAVAAAVFIAACGSSKEETPPAPSTDAAAQSASPSPAPEPAAAAPAPAATEQPGETIASYGHEAAFLPRRA